MAEEEKDITEEQPEEEQTSSKSETKVIPEQTNFGVIKPRQIHDEMSESYLDYAMSVIVARALPDVRDGLKPVQRRILYVMREMGLSANSKHQKSAKIIGQVMGLYHPHGDSSIYEAMVRMAQWWSLRMPLVNGQGNFGSMDNDPAAAMRYCLTGDALVVTNLGMSRIDRLSSPGVEEVSLKVLSAQQKTNSVSKWFDCGEFPVSKVQTRRGYEVTGTSNHPLLVLQDGLEELPKLVWKTIAQIEVGDWLALDRSESLWPTKKVATLEFQPQLPEKTRIERHKLPEIIDEDFAFILGSLLAEGTFRQKVIEFTNTAGDYADEFQAAWKRVFPTCRLHIFNRPPSSYGRQRFYQMQVVSTQVIRFINLLGLSGKSATRQIPEVILRSPKPVVAAFLRAFYEGDGAVEKSGRSLLRVGLSAKNKAVLQQVQTLLLRFGIVSTLNEDKGRRSFRLLITGKENIDQFAHKINFFSAIKKAALERVLSVYTGTALSKTDYIPFISEYVRANAIRGQREWLGKNNFDRPDRFDAAMPRLTQVLPRSDLAILGSLNKASYLFEQVVSVKDAGNQRVYSVRVDSNCHSFVANGFINHNTEAKLVSATEALLADIDKDTVDFQDNYDGTHREPVVLPARLPNLLINGSQGIAVGLATNIPPHNVGEIIDGLLLLQEKPEADMDELIDIIKGPDFPTGGIAYGQNDIKEALSTGRGRVVVRGRAEIQEEKNRSRIIINELPYQTNKATFVTHIADLVKSKRIEGISDLRDESDQKDGVRVVVELKVGAMASKILNQLYELTELQSVVHYNLVALVDGIQPRLLNVFEVLSEFLAHRITIVTRRTEYDLKIAKARAHILEGLKIALDHLDAIIKLIRAAKDRDEAKSELKKQFELSELQANAILDMRLSQLANLERQRIYDEYDAVMKLIADLEDILAKPARIQKIIKDELLEMKAKFDIPRKTEIRPEALGQLTAIDLIPEESVLISLTRGNYVKRLPADTYKSQHRGGKGVIGMSTRDDDAVVDITFASTHDDIMFFTDAGRVFVTKAYEIPASSRQSKGVALPNLIRINAEEKVTALITLPDKDRSGFFFFATKFGVVKRVPAEAFKNVRKSGVVAIGLRSGDILLWVKRTTGKDEIAQMTKNGQVILYNESESRAMGRSAAGVRGMRLKGDDEIIETTVLTDESEAICVISKNGIGKKVDVKEFRNQHRGGSGIRIAKLNPKTGLLAGGTVISKKSKDLIIVSDSGQVIRIPITSVKRLSRQASGVILMRSSGSDKVVSLTVVNEGDEVPIAEEEAQSKEPPKTSPKGKK